MSHEMAVQLARISDETQVKVNPPVILQSHYRFAESGELAFGEEPVQTPSWGSGLRSKPERREPLT